MPGDAVVLDTGTLAVEEIEAEDGPESLRIGRGMARVQACATPGCVNQAAFTTNSKPTWCTSCLDDMLVGMGLDPLEEFTGRKVRRLTRCRKCSAECHYLLDYLLDLQTRDEPACRFCFWTEWAEMANRLSGLKVEPVGSAALKEMIALGQREPVAELTPIPSDNHPVVVRCIRCDRQEARRPNDLNCSCGHNPVPRQGSATGGRDRGRQKLFANSDSPALKWWDHHANSEAEFKTVSMKARRDAWWICPECGLKFSAKVYVMADRLRPECPSCEETRSLKWQEDYERLKQTPVSSVPELAASWADDTDPDAVMVEGDWRLYRFRCPNGHYPKSRPGTFLSSGCPSCKGQASAAKDRPMLAEVQPELASQWHPDRNGRWTPENVVPGSQRRIHWKAACCGYEWVESPASRDGGRRLRCPRCETILDSLAWSDPGLAAEWSEENLLTAWHVRPTANTAFIPKWVCSVDRSHVWESTLGSRSSGSECPECRQAGKSRIELHHLEAAEAVFDNVRSGAIVRDKVFNIPTAWSIDILAEHDGLNVAIEYDGAYWHAPEPKQLIDRVKSLDLLAAGYLVVRLREDDLPPLDIDDPSYLEIRVYSKASYPEAVIAEVAGWLGTRKPENS
ncbi:zinc-ribbon domain-containing protein [Arthrobacter sulfonylureivorans]|uniref:zinc-ribbon domain-containing protein n=1 Tax=Arthrobacter sulfonylureivorans TaxID=2486855 RepID=UPI0039E6894D